MEPLITIETVPISIEYVERKSTCSSAGQLAELYISKQENRMTIQSQPITIRMRDTYEPGPAPNWNNLTYTASARFSEDGNLKMDVRMGDAHGDDFLFQQFGRGIENIMDFLPKSADSNIDVSGNMQIHFNLNQLPGGMPTVNNIDTSFLPPDLEIRVVERPKVIIKYVGDPLYIPKSSDPDYVPPETEEPYQGAEPDFNAIA
ncbi:MAG: hypothetical protein PHT29_05425 [Eubacteriales bacterium]|nr:hypothetical protein [Eubacteriales bacterium]MDD3290307.1 hypothetical protein [Eubacteriales bacterium]MDD3863255.1 hypothetical protein [Eubacteriales bacterium]